MKIPSVHTSYINQILNSCSQKQRLVYETIKRLQKSVKVSNINDVKDPHLVHNMNAYINNHFELKQCYSNSCNLTEHFNNITYCEGYVYDPMFPGLPIEHAWNCWTNPKSGRKIYFDGTFEKLLDTDVSKCDYVLVKEYNLDEVLEMKFRTETYGLWIHEFIKIKSN